MTWDCTPSDSLPQPADTRTAKEALATVRPNWSKGPCLVCGRKLSAHDADPIGAGLTQYTCPEETPR